MKKKILFFVEFLNSKSKDILCYLSIIFIGYAFFNISLRFVPVDFDDLVLLSVVKNTTNPLRFFIQDWGFGNYGYRPLHSLSLWLGNRVFGVASGPNQLINIIFHITVILLLFRLINHLQSDRSIAFIFSCLSLVSYYTLSPATWVSDRPTLFVAFFLLIILNYFVYLGNRNQPNIFILIILSLLGVMSKESGLIIPLVSIYILITQNEKDSRNKFAIISLLLVIVTYVLFRFIIFGSQAGSYFESGYLYGFKYYESSLTLVGIERIIMVAENIFKNILAIFIPVFDGQGKISLIGTWTNSVILVFSTVSLIVAAYSKKLSVYQKISLVIVFLNAVLHFQVFRYRTLYIAQISLSIFIATSPLLTSNNKFRRMFSILAGAMLLLSNIHIVGEDLTYQLLSRLNLLHQEGFEQNILQSSSRIDADVIKQIISKYLH